MRGRVLSLLLAALTAVVWASPASVAYLCSMDGQRRAACCCAPDGDHAEAGDADAHLQRQDCCKVERTSAVASPSLVASKADPSLPIATLPSWASDDDDAVFVATAFVPRLPRGPPLAVGPPPYLRHRRLLI